MLIHRAPTYAFYCGDAIDKLYPAEYLALDSTTTHLLKKAPYDRLKSELHISDLSFLHQTHSTLGYHLEKEPSLTAFSPFTKEGDYLITTTKKRGIGVMTADCLPIIMVDQSNSILAIVHAGWRGSVAGIVQEVLQKMGSSSDCLEIFFGPSARDCCYEVDPLFTTHIPPALQNKVFTLREGKLFFDVPEFNSLLLQSYGVDVSRISRAYNICTMCDTRFFSHRRQGSAAGRQMTVATLL